MPIEKRSHLKGAIIIGHCRGHDCIILIFCFEGFYDNHRRLSKNYFRYKKKMGCSESNEPKVRIYDCTPPGDDF